MFEDFGLIECGVLMVVVLEVVFLSVVMVVLVVGVDDFVFCWSMIFEVFW